MDGQTKATTKWGFWKTCCIIMIAANTVMVTYILFTFNLLSSIRDSLGNIDSPIVFSLTLLQTFIALGAFAGFWVIKGSAKEAAREAAEECSPACIDKWLSKNMEHHLVNYFDTPDGRGLVARVSGDAQARQNIANNVTPPVEDHL